MCRLSDFELMVNPRIIALIGASDKDGPVEKAILENLLLFKSSKIYLVNPSTTEILGLRCYPTITDIPEQIDVALIATYAAHVPSLVEDCGKA